MPEAKFCPKCGAPRTRMGAFCGRCGHRFVAPDAGSTSADSTPAEEQTIPAQTQPAPMAPQTVAEPPPVDVSQTEVQPRVADTQVRPAAAPEATTRPAVYVGSLVGAGLVAAAAFLPWFSVGGVSASSDDIPLRFIATGAVRQEAPDLIIVLLIVAAGLLGTAFLAQRVTSWVSIGLGAIAFNLALMSIMRVGAYGNGLSVSLGVFAALTGGAVVFGDQLRMQLAASKAAT